MTLPELPKQNKKREADFGLQFRKLVEPLIPTLPKFVDWELKDSRGKDRINLKEITDEQINFALRSRSAKGHLARNVVGTVGMADYTSRHDMADTYYVIRFPQGIAVLSLDQMIEAKRKYKSLSYPQVVNNPILRHAINKI